MAGLGAEPVAVQTALPVIPVQAGIQESRPESQADYAGDICRDNSWLSFPPGGNVCNKPLDSGLRRNDNKSNGNILTIPNIIAA